MYREIDINEVHSIELEMLNEISRICRDNNISIFLHAGSILGAVRHGGFIPWDEDVDLIITIDQYEKFCDVCERSLSHKYKLLSCKDSDYKEFFPRVVLRNQDPLCAYIDIFLVVGAPNTIEQKQRFLRQQHRLLMLRYYRFLNVSEAKDLKRKILRIVGKTLAHCIPLSMVNKCFFRLHQKYKISQSKDVLCAYGRYGMRNYFESSVFSGQKNIKFETLELKVPTGYETILRQFYGDYMKYPAKDIIDAGISHVSYLQE